MILKLTELLFKEPFDPNNEPAGILIDNLLHGVGDWKQLGKESGKPGINGNEE